MKDTVQQFATKLRKLRKSNKMSQEALAHEAGLHRTYIGQIERCEKNVSIKNIAKLANALKVDARELFTFDDLE